MKATSWYPRFAAIPHVHYVASEVIAEAVNTSRLTGFDTRPRVKRHEWDGETRESLWWRYGGTETTASPAKAHTAALRPGEAPLAHLLRELAEKLELPGTPSDYHFALLLVEEELWKRRREQPEALLILETVCWLDIRLLEACPDALRMEGERHYPYIPAFEYLAKLFEGEGYLHEVLDVARRAESFGKLEGRAAALAAQLAEAMAEA